MSKPSAVLASYSKWSMWIHGICLGLNRLSGLRLLCEVQWHLDPSGTLTSMFHHKSCPGKLKCTCRHGGGCPNYAWYSCCLEACWHVCLCSSRLSFLVHEPPRATISDIVQSYEPRFSLAATTLITVIPCALRTHDYTHQALVTIWLIWSFQACILLARALKRACSGSWQLTRRSRGRQIQKLRT